MSRSMILIAAAGVALACSGASGAPLQAGACAVGEIPAEEAVARVPFDLVDGRIYVQVRVDGRGPFRFAVDTGASDMARADAKLVVELGLPRLASVANSDGVSTAAADTVRIRTLQLGGLARSDVDAISRDYRSRSTTEAAFDGILARDFFADGLLVIDYPARTLTFSRTRSLPPGTPDTLAYQRAFRIPVAIGDVQAEGNLDTGANIAFVLPRTLYDRLQAGPLQPAGSGQLANGRIETWRASVPGPFRIGNIALRDAEVRVSERFPELLVGAHALQRSVLLIDQRYQRVAVCPR